jgi:hypothetical protein
VPVFGASQSPGPASFEKAKLEITPVSGADIEKLVKQVYGTPKEAAAKAAAMIR